ncbi:beta-lactamase family protein [Plectosphaerella plurivora]|uniref:Beta-lactamase family protein n=1 Tax=Plectosphaerella plurivora TaxID=936078 RepID=A0A9P8V4Q9_9PEZI|nr:beta-lactamase family protein [Plectosphaerella plurivora]
MKSITTLLPLALAIASTQAYCPPTGPVLPPPTLPACPSNLTSTTRRALEKISSSTDATFSVQVTSRNHTFFSHHHTGTTLADIGTAEVDGESVYRLASVTKVFTVLSLLLQEGVDLDLPASHYVAELDNVPGYESTTLRMLASQLAGVPRDGYMFDLTSGLSPEMLKSLGLPSIEPPANVPKCDAVSQGQAPCTRSEFFDVLAGAGTTWQPGQKAAYSNLAFIILGFAVENITGTPYVEVVRDTILEPLGMTSTGYSAPELSRLVVPNNSRDFAVMDVYNYNATGGLYSTPNDLSSFLRGLLNFDLLNNARTSAWLKPQAFTSSPLNSVGAPWEIYRPTSLLPDNRPLDVYTKSGGLPGYNAYIALVPEFDIGISVNVAGAGDKDYDVVRAIFSSVLETLVPGLDALARTQAAQKYAGTYTSGSGNTTSSLVMSVDDGPGLKVEKWTLLGNNVLDIVAMLNRAQGAAAIDVRAYPIGEDERWLLVTEKVGGDQGAPAVYAGTCDGWFLLDQVRFAGLPTDEIDFVVKDGEVVGAVSPGLRQQLTKS